MFSVSPEFKAAVRGSHRVTVRAEVWRSGVFLRSVDVLEGVVDVDARRAQRRTCQLRVAAQRPSVEYTPVWNRYASLVGSAANYAAFNALYPNYSAIRVIVSYDEVQVDEGLVPTSAFSDLAPFGNELYLWRGVAIDNVPLTLTYAKIKTQGLPWGLVSGSVTWGSVGSGVTWSQADLLPAV